MNTRIQHILKFKLWVLSNTYSSIKSPIRYFGGLLNQGIEKSWKDKLVKKLSDITPNNEYARDSGTCAQVMVFTSEEVHHVENNGIGLLLNHMRVPYYINNIQSISEKDISNLSLVIFIDESIYEKNKRAYKWNKDTAFIIFSSKTKNTDIHEKHNRAFIEGAAYRLLSPYDGLRSVFAANIINAIKRIVKIPLVTGMPTKSIGLRIDDVKGENIDVYLNDISKYHWHPDLGIFLDDMAKCKKSVKKYLSDLNKEGVVSIGPHAYSNEKFIFYNYPKGVPYSQSEFDEIWRDVLNHFKENSFNLSPVINAHFHVLSKSSASKIVKSGVKYFFSELEIDGHNPIPSKEYWPTGDPLNCTGKFNASGVFQLSSGDNILDTLSSRSYYDFLMHSDNYNLDVIRKRILHRLKISLDCGFAAYITTHEYLLNDMGYEKNKELWNLIDFDLKQKLGYEIRKVSLGSIGREFETIRKSVINSVRLDEGLLKIEMKGGAEVKGKLTVFQNNNIIYVPIPAYKNKCKVEVKI
jgi:hypothetical protein